MNLYSEEAEKGLISSMMLDPTVIGDVIQKVQAKHVYIHALMTMFVELVKLWEASQPTDLITFTNHLREKKVLDKIGGASYVTEVYGFVPSPSNYAYYCDIIESHYNARSALSLMTAAGLLLQHSSEASNKIISNTSAELNQLLVVKTDRPTFFEMVQDKVERMQSGLLDADIIRTGLSKIDHYSPLRKGDMPLLTGERKSGKSITALTIAKNVAHDGGSVLYFSLESPFPEIMDRLYAGESRIPMGLHHHTRLNEEQAAKACKAAESLGKLVFDIRDDVYDLSTMVAIIRQSEATLVIADYAQLIRPNLKDSNREQEVAKISRTLRLIAMETKKPIILLSQLNEQGRSRESRALEQDTTANWNIVFDEDEPNERTIEIPYQRNGESGIRFKVAFLGSIARVENLAYEPPQKEINYA